jgi:hypothetical protein
MRPLLCRLRRIQVVPRLLAGDLEVLAIGRAHATKLVEAQEAIGRHLQAMGSRVATGPGKSVAYASSRAGCRRLNRVVFAQGEELAASSPTGATWALMLPPRRAWSGPP